MAKAQRKSTITLESVGSKVKREFNQDQALQLLRLKNSQWVLVDPNYKFEKNDLSRNTDS